MPDFANPYQSMHRFIAAWEDIFLIQVKTAPKLLCAVDPSTIIIRMDEKGGRKHDGAEAPENLPNRWEMGDVCTVSYLYDTDTHFLSGQFPAFEVHTQRKTLEERCQHKMSLCCGGYDDGGSRP